MLRIFGLSLVAAAFCCANAYADQSEQVKSCWMVTSWQHAFDDFETYELVIPGDKPPTMKQVSDFLRRPPGRPTVTPVAVSALSCSTDAPK